MRERSPSKQQNSQVISFARKRVKTLPTGETIHTVKRLSIPNRIAYRLLLVILAGTLIVTDPVSAAALWDNSSEVAREWVLRKGD